MKVERTPTVLTIREAPGCIWLLGAFFIIVGAFFVYGASGGYSNFYEITYGVMLVHIFLGTCAVAAGVWVIFSSPRIVIRVDRNTETVTIRQSRLGGSTTKTYSFEEVRGCSLLEDMDSDGDPVWSVQLETMDGDRIRCSSFASSSREFTSDIAFELTTFMYKQMPSYKAPDELKDERDGLIR